MTKSEYQTEQDYTNSHDVEQLADNNSDLGLDDDKIDWNDNWKAMCRIFATYYGFIVFGMSDSSLGALLPSLERYYKLTYLVVSTAFLAPFTGYIIAALLSDHVHRWIGRWGASTLGVALQLVCFIIALSGPPPFAVFVIGYGIGGVGNGLLEASWNSYLGIFKQANQVMGIMHACYGVGGVLCPTIFTAMIDSGKSWNLCYAVLVGMAGLSCAIATAAFWGEGPQKYRESVDSNQAAEQENNNSDTIQKNSSSIRIVLKNKLVWLLALALFLYVGSEVSLGGWVSTFMIEIRHGDRYKMGYVTTGFWVGITVGRVVLGFVTGYFKREELLATGYLACSIVFVLLFWLVPSLILSAICAGVIGFFIGPLFPTVVVVALKKLPKWLHVSGIGFSSALGGGGAAVLPFVNGAIANTYGSKILGPFVFSLLMAKLIVWLVVLKFF